VNALREYWGNSYMPKRIKRKDICDPRKTYLDNLRVWKQLKPNVVVSSIQGLMHVADIGDEKYLIPFIDCDNQSIASEALSMLWMYYPTVFHIKDRIVEFATAYPKNDEEENLLQLCAIRALEHYAAKDTSMFFLLVEIAERYGELPDTFEAHQANVSAWEALANLTGEKISGKEETELTWNILSDLSEKIRERIRQAVLIHKV